MSKGRKPPGKLPRDSTGEVERLADAPTLAEQIGNQAVQSRLEGSATSIGTSAVSEVAHRAALALRVAPRDAAWTDRLVRLVEASHLPEDRRTEIVERLRSDQATADDVVAALERWMGTDSPALRSELVGTLETVAPTQTDPSVERAIATELASRLPAVTPAAAEGLVRSLTVLVELVWDEEEEEGAPGDYAAEESGV